jgi:hypothetical protein
LALDRPAELLQPTRTHTNACSHEGQGA